MKVAREKLQRRMQTRCSQELAAALYRWVDRSEFKFKGRNRQIEFREGSMRLRAKKRNFRSRFNVAGLAAF